MQPWKTNELKVQQLAIQDADTEALDYTFNPNRAFRILTISLRIDATVIAVEDFTIAHDSVHGAKFDHTIDSQAMNTRSEHTFDRSADADYYIKGDGIKITFDNTDANGWGLLITYVEQ